MTLTESLQALRDMIGEPGETRHSDGALRDFLEQSQGDVAGLILADEHELIVTQATLPQPFVAGEQEYELRGVVELGGLGLTEALLVLSVHWNGQALMRMTPEQQPSIDDTDLVAGQPRYYYQFGGHLGFYPVLSVASLASFTCEIHYAAWPMTWTSGESTLPEPIQPLMLAGAAIKARARARQWDIAGTLFVQWMQDLHVSSHIEQRRVTTKDVMRMPATDRKARRRR